MTPGASGMGEKEELRRRAGHKTAIKNEDYWCDSNQWLFIRQHYFESGVETINCGIVSLGFIAGMNHQ